MNARELLEANRNAIGALQKLKRGYELNNGRNSELLAGQIGQMLDGLAPAEDNWINPQIRIEEES